MNNTKKILSASLIKLVIYTYILTNVFTDLHATTSDKM